MRRAILLSLISLAVVAALSMTPASTAQGPPRTRPTAKSTVEEPAQKARYPALAYAMAILIILIVVAIVAFPSRKETWDQRAEKKRRRIL